MSNIYNRSLRSKLLKLLNRRGSQEKTKTVGFHYSVMQCIEAPTNSLSAQSSNSKKDKNFTIQLEILEEFSQQKITDRRFSKL